MDATAAFNKEINNGYTSKGESIILGAAMLDGVTQNKTFVKLPLKTLNRHGLIAGATGTGKTKTLQVFAENLSEKGIPVLVMDLKGDLSGLAKKSPGHPKIDSRHQEIGLPFTPKDFPVEFLSISNDTGVRLRSTVSEFGPTLLSRILQVSETQSSIIAVLFKYCDDNKLPLLDLNDFKKILHYATNEGKEEIAAAYGRISNASTGAILRKVIELEQQGADIFFGEPSFDVNDLLQIDTDGSGFINVLRLTDIQDRPKLFSTFMLCLLAEIYSQFPEQGDTDRPELILCIDEAHLLFKQASSALLDQLESIIKLIRSKGVGVYFITQNPTDIPAEILSQLGLKIQHALRAFTAKDRKAIKQTAENYPISNYYKTDTLLTQLGIGEALITALNEKGIPTPLAATKLRAPMSRMDILSPQELKECHSTSKIQSKYSKTIDRKSAYEILQEKIEKASEESARQKAFDERKELEKNSRKRTIATSRRRSTRTPQNPFIKVLTSPTVIRSVLNTLTKLLK